MKKYCKTKKLFYKKYSHKIVFAVYGAWRISRTGIINAKKWAADPKLVTEPAWYSVIDRVKNIKNSKKSLYQFICLFEKHINVENVTYSASHDRVIVYFSDDALLEKFETNISDYIKEVWKPADTNISNYLENNVNVVVCNKLPFNQFQCKVYLKYMLPESVRESLYNWYLNSVEIGNVKMSKSLELYISKNKNYMSTNYFYIKNEDDILLITMLLDKFISKVERYKIENNIKELNILSIEDNINAST
jgi:hypothetical protein